MIREQVFKLNPRVDRPMMYIQTNSGKKIWALYDTGAYVPVWTSKESLFLQYFKNADFVCNTSVGWFGGETSGKVYKVTFRLRDIVYPGLPVFIPDREQDASYSMILSATMFKGLDYNIDTRNHYLTVHIQTPSELVRNLTCHNKNGKLIVLANN